MGEAKRRREKGVNELAAKLGLETPGGRIHVHWDHDLAATPNGQMAFFIEFLGMTGLWEKWVEGCPLGYTSPNGSTKRDILGTWLLSVLSGHYRYAHIAGLRADGVNPKLLGMGKVVSEDTMRRALLSIDEGKGMMWLGTNIEYPVLPLLGVPWILDADVTVKPLYGKQEGAVVGYNPHKHGRPSHAYHTYMMAGLRLVMGVAVEAGNETHAGYGLPGLTEILDRLPLDQRPRLVRGDCSYGSDTIMKELEERKQSYLFKLRMTTNVRRYIEKVFFDAIWKDAGQGWEGREGELKLQGWDRARRVILLRRRLEDKQGVLDGESQGLLEFLDVKLEVAQYEYSVLVTDLSYEVLSLAQLYRDRGDAENAFDELKNQWGWGGYTTQDLKRCRFAAMGVALIYNWWSLFVRLANPKARMEAITSRPLLLSGIAYHTSHAGQKHLRITPIHAQTQKATEMLSRVSRLLNEWKQLAEQLKIESVLARLCNYLINLIAGSPTPKTPFLLPAPA